MIALVSFFTLAAFMALPLILFWLWTGLLTSAWLAAWSSLLAWPLVLATATGIGLAVLLTHGIPAPTMPHWHALPHWHTLQTLTLAALAIAAGIWLARLYPRHDIARDNR